VSDEEQRKKDLFNELLKDDGISTLSTDFSSEKAEEEAIRSQNKPKETCRDCDGTGKCTACDGKGVETCRTCYGSGRVGGGHEKITYGHEHTYYYKASGFGGTCPDCGGTGIHKEGSMLTSVKCTHCNGTGICLRCKGTKIEP
jgi:hypothetical protein